MVSPLSRFSFIRNATQNEIKDAYRKMAMISHPDRNDGCELKGNEFKKATEAYQVLSGESVIAVINSMVLSKKQINFFSTYLRRSNLYA
jgi:molecular chaperone DnaJ